MHERHAAHPFVDPLQTGRLSARDQIGEVAIDIGESLDEPLGVARREARCGKRNIGQPRRGGVADFGGAVGAVDHQPVGGFVAPVDCRSRFARRGVLPAPPARRG